MYRRRRRRRHCRHQVKARRVSLLLADGHVEDGLRRRRENGHRAGRVVRGGTLQDKEI